MNNKLKIFCEFEKNKNLFSRTYLGIPYWQNVRITFSRSFTQEIRLIPIKRKYPNKILMCFRLCKDLIKDLLCFFMLSERDILYFDECVYRYVDGEIVDSYFDYFKFDEEYTIQRCFHIYNRQEKSKRRGIGTSIPKLAEYLLYMYSRKYDQYCLDSEEDVFLKQLAIDIEETFHTGFTSNELIQMVRRVTIIHKIYKRFYEKLLVKCNPKAIFVVAHYSSYLFPLYNVARKKSIPIIEIQHGLIVDHDAYWYEDISAIGKELPTHLFSYGTFWGDYIKLPVNMKVVAVGNPFLENRKIKYKNCIQDKKSIVFYSSAPAEKEMEQIAIDAWKVLGGMGYKIYFKIHPLDYDMRSQRYTLLVNFPQIRIVPPETDLYELLSCIKHHVTYASTVFFEAAIFNNNRYVYDLGIISEGMRPLIEMKLAYKFKSIEELVNLLDVSMDSISIDTPQIWEKEARENGLTKLREIIDEK